MRLYDSRAFLIRRAIVSIGPVSWLGLGHVSLLEFYPVAYISTAFFVRYSFFQSRTVPTELQSNVLIRQ
jgi:hypothetical protein